MLHISSIKKFLLSAVIGLIALVWGGSALQIYNESQEQVEELFDAELAQMARIIQTVISASLAQNKNAEELTLDYPDQAVWSESFGDREYTELAHKYEKKLAFQVWSKQGKLFFENHLRFPAGFEGLNKGFHAIESERNAWQSFTLYDSNFGFWVRVAQRADVRTEVISEIAWNTIWPSLVLVPFLLLVLGAIIQKGLFPLTKISQELKGRDFRKLSHVNEKDYPLELQRMVLELNNLFSRVSEASERERRFTADASHELRTPLTISKVHLQNIQQVNTEPRVDEFVSKALIGIERLIHMVQQLLMLSRLDSNQENIDQQDINVKALCLEVIEDLSQNGKLAGIELSLNGEDSIIWYFNDSHLHILLRNLLDNATRYALPGTRIDVALQAESLTIKNECQDLSDEAISQLMERFKRGNTTKEGSGLGLSICTQICQQNAYRLNMKNRDDGPKGLEVSVVAK